jgi:hypothetical protein
MYLHKAGAWSVHQQAQEAACLGVSNRWLKSEMTRPSSWGSQCKMNPAFTLPTHKPNSNPLSGKARPSHIQRKQSKYSTQQWQWHQPMTKVCVYFNPVWELLDMTPCVHPGAHTTTKNYAKPDTRDTSYNIFPNTRLSHWMQNSLHIKTCHM